MARWVLIAAQIGSLIATMWLIVDSHTSYVPMPDWEMQNLYIDRIVKFGGAILLFQSVALVATCIVIKSIARKSSTSE
jgi:hypothetical protein